jgi:hypothetical protein
VEILRKRKNVARKQFLRAAESEKEGPRQIWQDLVRHHNALSKGERLCRKRRETIERFFKNPFVFARDLFEPLRSRKLEIGKDQL